MTTDNVCENNGLVTLAGGTPLNGVYSGNGVSTDGTNYFFDPSFGDQTITYTYTDGLACSDVATAPFTVNPLPNVTLILADNDACIDEATVTLTGGLPAGGTYSGVGVVDLGGGMYGFTPASGDQMITYTYEDVNGCENTATEMFTIYPLPTASITETDMSGSTNDDGIICAGDHVGLVLPPLRMLVQPLGSPPPSGYSKSSWFILLGFPFAAGDV